MFDADRVASRPSAARLDAKAPRIRGATPREARQVPPDLLQPAAEGPVERAVEAHDVSPGVRHEDQGLRGLEDGGGEVPLPRQRVLAPAQRQEEDQRGAAGEQAALDHVDGLEDVR